MTITRRQLFKSVFSAAATVALAKVTATKLEAPLLTEVKFKKYHDMDFGMPVVVYQIAGRYNGPGPHNGERASSYFYASPEAVDDLGEEPFFEMAYRELLDFVLEEA